MAKLKHDKDNTADVLALELELLRLATQLYVSRQKIEALQAAGVEMKGFYNNYQAQYKVLTGTLFEPDWRKIAEDNTVNTEGDDDGKTNVD